jgi:Sec-independent protein translocase protein TatA
MELQLLVILLVALVVFGPEKMLEFATQMGRFVRKMKQEWAQIQLELQMQELKKKLDMQTKEGEEKVKQYLFGETPTQPVSQRQFLPRGEEGGRETQKVEPKNLSMEDLFSGKAPVVDDENKTPGKRGRETNPESRQ